VIGDDFDGWLADAAKGAGVAEVLESKAIAKLRAQLHKSRRRIKAAETERDEYAERVDALITLTDAPPTELKIKRKATKKKSKTQGVPVMLWSDWHVEEQVDPITVNDRNEYNPKIAKRRSERIAEGCAWLIETLKAGWEIKRAVIWLGGDLITGYIHEELVESNAMSPTNAILLAQKLIEAALLYIAEECKLERIDVICNHGNHGRTTMKRRVQTSAANSYENLLYKVMASRFEDDPRFHFQIAEGSHSYAEVLGETIRFHHGDDIRYGGGIGGLTIPLRKAINGWTSHKPADITCIGHFHQFMDIGNAVVNGSLIGWNAYALSIKATYEPPRQAFFLMDADHGKRLVTPVYVDGKGKGK